MSSFSFKKPVPTVGYETPTKIRIKQSATFDGTYSQKGVDQLLSGLPDDPSDSDSYVVTEPLAADDQYTRLYFITAADVEGEPAILEPKITDPTSFQIVAYARDAGLDIIAGIELDLAPVGNYTPAGDVVVLKRAEAVSDASGRASIDTIPADSGIYNVNFGGNRKRIDSTGKGGTSINWGDIES